MHQLSRYAFRRNHVEPPALGHRVFESEHAVGNRIPVKNVVEQPPVKLLFVQGLLDSNNVRHRNVWDQSAGNIFQSTSAQTATTLTPRTSTRFVPATFPAA